MVAGGQEASPIVRVVSDVNEALLLPVSSDLVSSSRTVWVDDVPVVLYEVERAEGAVFGTVVFLHGWGLGPRSYADPIGALAAHGYRVVALGLPGFGGSGHLPGQVSREELVARVAAHVVAALDAAAIDGPVLLVGHSFGAGVAVMAAEKRPELFSGVVMLSPIGGDVGALSWVRALWSLSGETRHSTLERARDALPVFVQRFGRVVSTGIAAKSTDLVDVVTEVSRLMPVTIVVAEDDRVTPVGPLRHVESVRYRDVPGSHGWLLDDGASAASEVRLHELDAGKTGRGSR